MGPNLKKVRRIKLSVASVKTDLLVMVLDMLEGDNLGPLDVDAGWSIYEGQREARVDVTLHEGTVYRVLDLWRMFRRDPNAGVDCGRVYMGGDDYCCKDLDNYTRRKNGIVERFPGYSFKLGTRRLRFVRQ